METINTMRGRLKIKIIGFSTDEVFGVVTYLLKRYESVDISRLIANGGGGFHIFIEINPKEE